MEWIAGKGVAFAYGAEHGYLVLTGEREVRLSRFLVATGVEGLTAVTAREATESTIILPLGRGPGRPGGEPELDALASCARVFAEAYESGESLEDYPAWQHARLSPGPRRMDNPKAAGAPAGWRWGYLPCGCRNDGFGNHVDARGRRQVGGAYPFPEQSPDHSSLLCQDGPGEHRA